jgi:tetratricopeptide (TPR) repeat protein
MMDGRSKMGERRVLSEDPDAADLADQALAAWEASDFDTAEILWRKAAEGGSSRAMVNLGRNRLDAGDPDGATTWFRQADEAGDAEGAFWLGRMAFERGDQEEANRWRWRGAELGDISMLLWLAGNEPDPDPDESFNVALMVQAAEAGSHHARGMLCTRSMLREDYLECIRWGERAFELAEQEEDLTQLAKLHSVLGAAYRLVGRPADALPHYEKALSLAPEHVEVDPEDIVDVKREIDQAFPEGSFDLTSPSPIVMDRCVNCGDIPTSDTRFCTKCGQPRK